MMQLRTLFVLTALSAVVSCSGPRSHETRMGSADHKASGGVSAGAGAPSPQYIDAIRGADALGSRDLGRLPTNSVEGRRITIVEDGIARRPIEGFSDREASELLNRLGNAIVQHRPEIPGVALPPVFTPAEVFSGQPAVAPRAPGAPAPNGSQQIPPGFRTAEHPWVCVHFRDLRPGPNLSKVIGQGVLITDHSILTARHVAEDVQADLDAGKAGQPARFEARLLLPSRDFAPLKPFKVSFLSDGRDPDLAVILVEKVDHAWFPPMHPAGLQLRAELFLLGGFQFNEYPHLSHGFVTTSYRHRDVEMGLKQAMGTNLSSFPSQSGAGVYDAQTGALAGIFVGGIVKYAGTGESIVPAPADPKDWEQFKSWSWIVPVEPYAQRIVELSAETPR